MNFFRTLLQRAKAAASLVFWGGQGIGRRGTFGTTWQLPGSERDYAQLAGRIYDNSVVLSAINWMARNFPDAPLVIEKPKEIEGKRKWEQTGHKLADIVARPNEWYDETVLWQGTLLSLACTGNAYWYKIRSASGQLVGFAYVPHFQIRPMADKYNDGTRLVTYYEYRPLGVSKPLELRVEDVVHFRWGLDPQNPIQGLSPLAASLREIVGDNEAATYSAALLLNAGIPGLIISPKQDTLGQGPSAEQKGQFRGTWQETFRREGQGKVALMPFSMDVTALGFSPEQMALKSLRDVPVSRICSALGFDPMVLGLPSESKTYSNYREAIEAAYEGCLIPIKRIIGSQLTRQTAFDFPDEIYRCGWDYSGVRVLQADIDALWKRVTEGYKGGVAKRSEAKQLLGLDYDAKDEVYIQDIAQPVKEKELAKESAKRASARREIYETLGLGDEEDDDSE